MKTMAIRRIALTFYLLLAGGAIAAPLDWSDVDPLRTGTMRKLVLHTEGRPVADAPFITTDGQSGRLEDYQETLVVLNFWATWCAPCRREMPALAALQDEFGGDDFEVVTIATGRNALASMRDFMDEIGVDNLPLHRDPRQSLARNLGVLGLPATLIIDPDGNEIARLLGDADWHGESARQIVRALLKKYGNAGW